MMAWDANPALTLQVRKFCESISTRGFICFFQIRFTQGLIENFVSHALYPGTSNTKGLFSIT